ncbi:MAG: hypothetical protein QOI73_2857 [Solirubrobacteraceae bacterium]|nr:hypothetical protein [Solirubrobacteraceae bacterium]
MAPPGGIAADELAKAVRRATEAGLPVADVKLRGPGREFAPSRGANGRRYRPDEVSVRKLTLPDSDQLDGGISLYPPPGEDVRRLIVVPLERGNWLAYSEELEKAVTAAAQQAPPAPG